MEYPRLTAWNLDSPVDGDATSFRITAASGVCVDVEGQEVGFEPLDRVDVEETSTEVIVSAWLAEPETPRPTECAGMSADLPAVVELEEPLGDRELVDPACELPRYRHHAACVDEP